MTQFEEFQRKNGPGILRKEARDSVVRAYEKKLPQSLIEFWRQAGFCGYRKGLIWIVDPSAYQDLLSDWDVPPDAVVFGRTAFADLMLWANGQVQYLFVHHGRIAEVTDDLNLYFQHSLTSDTYVRDALMGKLLEPAIKRLGILSPDECYAFVPALALGGSGAADTLQRVKIREQLGVLAELVR